MKEFNKVARYFWKSKELFNIPTVIREYNEINISLYLWNYVISLYLCNYNGNGRCMITGEVKYKIEENIKKYSSLAKMSLY